MLPTIQRHQMRSLSKVLFIQNCATMRRTSVVLRVAIAGVLDRHSKVHAITKSHQGTIHTRVLSSQVPENSYKQGMPRHAELSRRLSCINASRATHFSGVDGRICIEVFFWVSWIFQKKIGKAESCRQQSYIICKKVRG